MSRLYLRFYFTLLGSLVVFVVIAAAVWHRVGGPAEHVGGAFAQLIQNALPPPQAAPADQQAALQRLARGLDAKVDLLAADGTPIGTTRASPPLSADATPARPWLRPWERDAVWTLRLPDGRRLLAAIPGGFRHPAHALLMTLAGLALVIGIAAFPLVRQLTQRLERLQRGVDSLGAGDLSARVPAEGKDEIGRLARSFNEAAARIEELVGAHKQLLANVSHELRTPLARIRMAIGMSTGLDAKQHAYLEQDVVELDRLIGEILLASRLDALPPQDGTVQDVDLLALAAEECARYPQVQLDGESCSLRGDPHQLRSLVRNLVENALRHGLAPVRVAVRCDAREVVMSVSDQGPGVPEAQREQIFEPFFRDGTGMRGTGLGLALVRKIARRHGGDVLWIPSPEPGCFSVRLPRCRD
jgi:signal transduction histidine kinase